RGALGGDGAVRSPARPAAPVHLLLGVALHLAQPGMAGRGQRPRAHTTRPAWTYVMVANHQSLLDILVLFRLFVHFKWVAKVELFKIPCIGWNMSLNRYVRLRRGDPESIAHTMRTREARR